MYIHVNWLIAFAALWTVYHVAMFIWVGGKGQTRLVLYVLRGAPLEGMSGLEICSVTGIAFPYHFLTKLEDAGYVRRTIDIEPVTIDGFLKHLKVHKFHLTDAGKDLLRKSA
ncbi:MAG: hypothetical protein QY323_03630 [Patescibacteria group bacterium]|nr:MAG: hypothetical protein QY323_03630 [Patescibacteria group bacterium]